MQLIQKDLDLLAFSENDKIQCITECEWPYGLASIGEWFCQPIGAESSLTILALWFTNKHYIPKIEQDLKGGYGREIGNMINLLNKRMPEWLSPERASVCKMILNEVAKTHVNTLKNSMKEILQGDICAENMSGVVSKFCRWNDQDGSYLMEIGIEQATTENPEEMKKLSEVLKIAITNDKEITKWKGELLQKHVTNVIDRCSDAQ